MGMQELNILIMAGVVVYDLLYSNTGNVIEYVEVKFRTTLARS